MIFFCFIFWDPDWHFPALCLPFPKGHATGSHDLCFTPTLLCIALVDLPLWHMLCLGKSFSSFPAKVIVNLDNQNCKTESFIQLISKSLHPFVEKPPAIRTRSPSWNHFKSYFLSWDTYLWTTLLNYLKYWLKPAQVHFLFASLAPRTLSLKNYPLLVGWLFWSQNNVLSLGSDQT